MGIVRRGDFGKPRPALVIQSGIFNATLATVTVKAGKIGPTFGQLDVPCMVSVNRALAVFSDGLETVLRYPLWVIAGNIWRYAEIIQKRISGNPPSHYSARQSQRRCILHHALKGSVPFLKIAHGNES